MFKHLLAIALGALLVQIPIGVRPVAAETKTEKRTKLIERVRAGVLELGVGKEAVVEVKLRDRTKLSGFVSESNQESFAITDFNTGRAITVAYPDVAQVKGHNLSTGAKIAIVALSVAVALLAFFLYLENAN